MRNIRAVIRPLLLVLGVTFLASACTPGEKMLWDAWFKEAPEQAAAAAAQLPAPQQVDGVPALTDEQFAAAVFTVQQLQARTGIDRYDAMIDQAGLPSHFHTVMRKESGGRPDAVGPNGEIGLLQIMPSWAGSCGTTRSGLFDPWTNIQCAVHVYAVSGGGAWTTW